MKQLTTEEWKQKAIQALGSRAVEETRNAVYKGSTEKVELICAEHGSYWMKPGNYTHLKQRCPHCMGNAKLTLSSFVSKAALVHNNKYDYSETDTFKNNRSKINIVCPIHGAFTQTVDNHLAGHGCPACASGGVSAKELELRKFITDELQETIQANSREIIPPLELDIFIPTRRLAIEFNGRYYHTDKFKTRKSHVIKSDMCEKEGIQLLHISEIDWDKNKQLVLSSVNAKLGKFKSRVFARKCEVRVVCSADAKRFQTVNHLQGAAVSSVRLGLYYNSTLMALMTFGKPRFNANYSWELIRYCSLQHTQVVGGASKLLKAFRKKYTGSIISYARRDYSVGRLYEALQFKKVGTSAPNYVWVRQKEVLARYQTQKHKLHKLLGSTFDESKSEAENMLAAGYHRLYDSGNLIYLLD